MRFEVLHIVQVDGFQFRAVVERTVERVDAAAQHDLFEVRAVVELVAKFGQQTLYLHAFHFRLGIAADDKAGVDILRIRRSGSADDHRSVRVEHIQTVVSLVALYDSAVLADVLKGKEVPVLRSEVFGYMLIRHFQRNRLLTRSRCGLAGCIFGFHLCRSVGRHTSETFKSPCSNSRRCSRFHGHHIHDTAVVEHFLAHAADLLAELHFL